MALNTEVLQDAGTNIVCKSPHWLALMFSQVSQREASKMTASLSKHLNLDHLGRSECKPGSWKFWKRSCVYKGSTLQIMGMEPTASFQKTGMLGIYPTTQLLQH